MGSWWPRRASERKELQEKLAWRARASEEASASGLAQGRAKTVRYLTSEGVAIALQRTCQLASIRFVLGLLEFVDNHRFAPSKRVVVHRYFTIHLIFFNL